MTTAAASALTTTPADPNPAAAALTTPATAATPAPAANEYSWLGDTPQAEMLGYVQNKGWKGARDVVEGYQNLEKLRGVPADRLLSVPTDDKPEAWAQVYDRLGRPKTAAEYKLPVPDGADVKFVEAASTKFHELGLSAKQGQALATWWNEQAGGSTKAAEEAATAQSNVDMEGLRTEWGNGYDAKIEAGRRAARQFGIDGETAGKLEKALGTGGLLKLMSKIGEGLGESGASGLDATGGALTLGMTPDQAKAEIERLKKDPEWSKSYSSGDSDKRKRWDALHKAAYPS